MAKVDKSYLDLLEYILKEGFRYEDPNRKGIYRIQVPSYTFYHEFKDGFPKITTKDLYWKAVVGELIWFLKGDTNIKYLNENNIHIWDKDAKNFSDNGDLGPIYGAQWRRWRKPSIKDGEESIDQLQNLIRDLKEKPLGTQHIVTAWNPSEIDKMALPPCHWSFQILVQPMEHIEKWDIDKAITPEVGAQEDSCESKKAKYGFTLKWNQRSVDTFLGLPFNIASYALLAHIIAELTDMVPLAIEGNLSNVHLYEPHLDAVKKQMARSVNMWNSKTTLILSPSIKDLCTAYKGDDITFDALCNGMNINDFTFPYHTSQSALKAEMFARDE